MLQRIVSAQLTLANNAQFFESLAVVLYQVYNEPLEITLVGCMTLLLWIQGYGVLIHPSKDLPDFSRRRTDKHVYGDSIVDEFLLLVFFELRKGFSSENPFAGESKIPLKEIKNHLAPLLTGNNFLGCSLGFEVSGLIQRELRNGEPRKSVSIKYDRAAGGHTLSER